jgi:hypothetical protein
MAIHLYEIRPRNDGRGIDLISEHLSHGGLWYEKESDATSYVRWHSRVTGAQINIFNKRSDLVRTYEIEPGSFAY